MRQYLESSTREIRPKLLLMTNRKLHTRLTLRSPQGRWPWMILNC